MKKEIEMLKINKDILWFITLMIQILCSVLLMFFVLNSNLIDDRNIVLLGIVLILLCIICFVLMQMPKNSKKVVFGKLMSLLLSFLMIFIVLIINFRGVNIYG